MAFVTKSTNQQKAEETAPVMNDASNEEPIEDSDADSEDDGAEVGKKEKSEKVPKPPGGKSPTGPRGGGSSVGGGFFEIYKKGQGYWTRMGTAIGIAVVSVFTAYNLYLYVPSFLRNLPETTANRVGIAVGLVTLLVLVGVGFWLTNKASNVDFLIATDSEMKKVNWTSRRDLIGSTKVVILFMFVVTIFLFVVDILFGELFHLAHVLQNGPFGGS
jgi:preprotein translocase SecE subunit